MQFIFIKPDLRHSGNANYSGGQHGYMCAAQSLAAAGHNVHLLYTYTKSELMFTLLQQGCMGSLAYSTAVEGVAVWSAHGMTHHVSLSDAQVYLGHDDDTAAMCPIQLCPALALSVLACCSKVSRKAFHCCLLWYLLLLFLPKASTAHQLSRAMAALCDSSQGPALTTHRQRLLDECSAIVRTHNAQAAQQHGQQQQLQDSARCWVVLDADGSQEPLPDSSSSLMEACCAAFPPGKLLLLVQNIHFLPLGPQGTAARRPALLQSWAQLGGILCVSSFVARYVAQHAVPLGLPPQCIYCVHYAAFGAFGRGPFPDYGTAAAQHLPWPADSSNPQHMPAQPQATPTVGCLKLSQEKGGKLFLELAAALPQLQFLAVCADHVLQAAAAALPNVRTVPPGDVDSLLQHMKVLLAPSLWQEAYGMVVTDAVLRGVPVIVSDQGGLSEAALGSPAAVVPVQPMQLPVTGAPDAAGAAPRWRDRVFPEGQELAGWAQALQRLLGHRAVYESCSGAGREAALRLVQHQAHLLDQMVTWLRQLG